MRVFSLQAGTEPVLDTILAANAEIHASANTPAAFSYQSGRVQLIDLKAPTLAVREVRLPFGLLSNFAANASGAWVISDWNAVIYEQTSSREPPRVLNCGAALAVAVANNGAFAVTAGAGQILLGDLRTRTVNHVLRSRADELGFSYDGAFLVARSSDGTQSRGDKSLRVYEVATGAVAEIAPPPTQTGLARFWLAAGSDRLANARCGAATTGTPTCTVDVTDLADFRVLGAGELVHTNDAVYDVSTGAKVWSTEKLVLRGAANLTHFLYAERGRIKVASHR